MYFFQHWSFCAIPRYPVILSIENHCSVPQQKKMAEYIVEVLQDKVDLSNVTVNETRKLPSPEILKGKVLVKVSVSQHTLFESYGPTKSHHQLKKHCYELLCSSYGSGEPRGALTTLKGLAH